MKRDKNKQTKNTDGPLSAQINLDANRLFVWNFIEMEGFPELSTDFLLFN